ncbi:MAG: hypothetical protein JNK93_18895, partial [Planctomycetia bacterium]|nr:hypothetical protein [Planctomycetia bacterium]
MPVTAQQLKNSLQLHSFPLRAATATNVAKILKELIAINDFEGSVTGAIADEDSNSILVMATENGKQIVEFRIKKLEESAAKRKDETRKP